jgi:hypothetical protein
MILTAVPNIQHRPPQVTTQAGGFVDQQDVCLFGLQLLDIALAGR